MSIAGYIAGRVFTLRCAAKKRWILHGDAGEPRLADWPASLNDPTAYYLACFRAFHREMPQALREHRRYFSQSGRGFGEDAFHVMWWLLFRRFRPANFLEIGVYRGQTVSLLALLARMENVQCDVHGISPFTSAGDSVSKYRTDLNYLEDTLANFRHFELPSPTLLPAYSTEPAARERIASRRWEAVYIDGNHDYEIARQDWEICSANIVPGGFIVLDDSARDTPYRPPCFATAGHPGPSRLAREIDRARFCEILRVGHNRVFQMVG